MYLSIYIYVDRYMYTVSGYVEVHPYLLRIYRGYSMSFDPVA